MCCITFWAPLVFFSLSPDKPTEKNLKQNRTLPKRVNKVLMFYRWEMKLKIKIIFGRKATKIVHHSGVIVLLGA
jgi:hypothetical protein